MKKKTPKSEEYTTETVCIWSAKPKIFTVRPFIEKVFLPLGEKIGCDYRESVWAEWTECLGV